MAAAIYKGTFNPFLGFLRPPFVPQSDRKAITRYNGRQDVNSQATSVGLQFLHRRRRKQDCSGGAATIRHNYRNTVVVYITSGHRKPRTALVLRVLYTVASYLATRHYNISIVYMRCACRIPHSYHYRLARQTLAPLE